MVASISFSAAPTPSQGAPPSGSLRQQLAQTQNQLSACLTCATANTPQTQAQIANLTVRVQQLKGRIQDQEAAPNQQPTTQPPAAGPTNLGSKLDLTG